MTENASSDKEFHEIIPGLYLGSAKGLKHRNELKITHVLSILYAEDIFNFTFEGPFLRLDLSDEAEANLLQILPAGLNFIHKALTGKPLLMASGRPLKPCKAGKQQQQQQQQQALQQHNQEQQQKLEQLEEQQYQLQLQKQQQQQQQKQQQLQQREQQEQIQQEQQQQQQDSQQPEGPQLYVHCHGGVSRSAAMVMAYLMKTRSWQVFEAHKHVMARRNFINPNAGFRKQLELFADMQYTLDPMHPGYRMWNLQYAATTLGHCQGYKTCQFSAPVINCYVPTPRCTRLIANKEESFCCADCGMLLATQHNVLGQSHIAASDRSCSARIRWLSICTGRYIFFKSQVEAACSTLKSQTSSDVSEQTSIFLEPIGWMEGAAAKSCSGELSCPSCKGVLGGFNWQGIISKEGNRVAPAFYIHTDRVTRTGGKDAVSDTNAQQLAAAVVATGDKNEVLIPDTQQLEAVAVTTGDESAGTVTGIQQPLVLSASELADAIMIAPGEQPPPATVCKTNHKKEQGVAVSATAQLEGQVVKRASKRTRQQLDNTKKANLPEASKVDVSSPSRRSTRQKLGCDRK